MANCHPMGLILKGYQVSDQTWFCLSSLLILAAYFKFSRLWSVRNLDILLLLSISPGLLLVRTGNGETVIILGYVWLFSVSGLLLCRMLYDGLIVRRPRLEQNMNAAGMTFLCAATFVILTGKLLTESLPPSTIESVRKGNELFGGESPGTVTTPSAADAQASHTTSGAAPVASPDAAEPGPGASLVTAAGAQLSKVVAPRDAGKPPSRTTVDKLTAHMIAISAHLAVILGLTLVGRNLFGDLELGFAMSTLYMLLPCTAFDVGKINHVLPSAFVVWSIVAYRRPFVSGVLLGLACAMMFFPVFLLPLWIAFYGRRGGLRFGAAVVMTTLVLATCLAVMSNNTVSFWRELLGFVHLPDLKGQFGASDSGFWKDKDFYRIPVFVAYLAMLTALTIWPGRKSMSHVITHSAAIVIGTQFWYPQQGGVYVLWYLPLLLMVLFRPLMTNHVAPEIKPLNLLAIFGIRERTPPELAASVADSGTTPR